MPQTPRQRHDAIFGDTALAATQVEDFEVWVVTCDGHKKRIVEILNSIYKQLAEVNATSDATWLIEHRLRHYSVPTDAGRERQADEARQAVQLRPATDRCNLST